VLRAAHLDGRTIQTGERFYFDVYLFDTSRRAFDHYVHVFSKLPEQGLGPRRRRVDFESAGPVAENGAQLIEIEISGGGEPAGRVRVDFLTPTELKGGGQIVDKPEFAVLFARLRDRIGALAALYGDHPLVLDWKELGQRAGVVKLTGYDLKSVELTRRSSRTGQVHGIGGTTGWAEYAGALGEFLPALRAGEWCGVGRHCVWGNGQISVTICK
jgi:hypothetical protein